MKLNCLALLLILSPNILLAQEADIHAAFQWFKNNPPKSDGINFQERREQSALIDRLGHDIPQEIWSDYYWDWNRKGLKRAKSIEIKYPILQYLRIAEKAAFDEIRLTKVVNGVKIWQLYNMGIIVKTPDRCFAIDLIPVTIDFTSLLDFAIMSHSDADHVDNDFIPAMLKAGKPVYAPIFHKHIWIMQLYPKLATTKITGDTVVQQGASTIFFKMSAQGDIPCLITVVNCGAATENFTLMHGGDSSIPEHYKTNQAIDFLVVHSGNEYPVVEQANPNLVNLSHNLELGHPQKWRNKYQDCYDSLNSWLKGLPPEKTVVLTWGESLYFQKN